MDDNQQDEPTGMTQTGMTQTYIITPDRGTAGGLKITCLRCDHTSYHPDDVANLYCGFCNDWHDYEAGLCAVLLGGAKGRIR